MQTVGRSLGQIEPPTQRLESGAKKRELFLSSRSSRRRADAPPHRGIWDIKSGGGSEKEKNAEIKSLHYMFFLRPLMNTQKLGWAMTGGKGREGKREICPATQFTSWPAFKQSFCELGWKNHLYMMYWCFQL